MPTLLSQRLKQHGTTQTLRELPAVLPTGFTAARQSDFARPRRALCLCLLSLAAAIVYASSERPQAPTPQPAKRSPGVIRTKCSSDCLHPTRPLRRFV
ncbi:hypothetical protein PPN31114_03531 [Pandoraea pneumonica]|uniref:Uncharacterized protein n=1 Tax=Pandoraea pneumonica TaxID=2508299 RepID=A0A5E4WXR6_9BURK|nr:hypothetical protein [Pandoraea pneumonica]VVE28570.1 hypothetical protein PPN31114_03531 [Pandoraea pneumonica]